MMVDVEKDLFSGSIFTSFNLFTELKCISGALSGSWSKDLGILDEDKMRSHILDCLIALRKVMTKKIEIGHQYEHIKSKIFAMAVSVIIDDKVQIESDRHIFTALLQSFPDEQKMADGRNWLPLHFAVALGNKVSEEDIQMLYSADPLAMRRYNLGIESGFTPGHFLCMRTHPNIQLIRHLSLRDLKAFRCEATHQLSEIGTNTLQLAAKHSESIELLRILLQIDHSMTKEVHHTTSFGFLCGRSRSIFPSFNEMLECLITADSSDVIVASGLTSCFESYKGSDCRDIEAAHSFIKTLLQLIEDEEEMSAEILSTALQSICMHLEGEFGVAMLSLLFTRYGDKAVAGSMLRDADGMLPIHSAAIAQNSFLHMVQFLLKVCPELLLETTGDEENILHMTISKRHNDRAAFNADIRHLCEKYPELLHMENNVGKTAFQFFITDGPSSMDLDLLKIMCEVDETFASVRCFSNDYFPLRMLWEGHTIDTEMSDATSCFRYLLNLYPSAANDVPPDDISLLDEVIESDGPDFLIRMILNTDRTVQPQRLYDLNYAARKEGMFLAFRALTSNGEPTIWIRLRHENIDLLMHTISYL